MKTISNPIGDMMNRIKIAGQMEKESITIPYSGLRFAVAETLAKKGLVGRVSKKGKDAPRSIEIEIAYREDGSPKISSVRPLSRPSRRMYFGAKDIRSVRRGYGTLVLSTPQGVLSGGEAKKANLGGEALFEVW